MAVSRISKAHAAGLALVALLLGWCPGVLAADPGKPVTVVGITLFEDLFFKEVVEGMKFAAKRDGVNLLLANSKSNLQAEEKIIDSYIRLGVDAIMLSPVDGAKSVAALRRAHDKGIKIIAYNDTLDADFLVTTIASSQRQLGASTGELAHRYIVEKMGGQARIAIVCFDSLLPKQSEARVQGFLDSATHGLPGARLITRQNAWEADKAIAVVTEILKAHPDVTLIFGANEGGTVGAQLAVKNAGLGAKVKVFGTDASKQELNMLLADDGVLQGVTGQQAFGMGQASVEAALKAVRGMAVGKTITVPGVLLTRDRPDEVRKYKTRLEAQ